MVFVSYSRADLEKVRPFVEYLKKNQIKYWLDNSSIPVGSAFVKKLGEALKQATVYLLIDTPASRISYWVGREKITAFRLYKSKRLLSVIRAFEAGLEIDPSFPGDISFPFESEQYKTIITCLNQHKEQLSKHGATGIESDDFGAFPEQPGNWSGRQDMLYFLDRWWQSGLPGAWISGLGGIGKSGLIQTWITALIHLGYENDLSIPISYLSEKEIANTNFIFEKINTWNKEFKRRSGLIVVDGFGEALENTEIEKIIEVGLSTRNKILISSRTKVPDKFKEVFTILILDSFSERDAMQYLIQSGTSGEMAHQISQRLANYPLALELFTKVLKTQNLSEKEALKQLDVLDIDAVSKGFTKNSSSPEGALQATFAVLTKSFELVSPTSKSLMVHLCKNNDQKMIWTEIKHSNLPHEEVENALEELAQLALIQVENSNSQKSISIHPVIKEFVLTTIIDFSSEGGGFKH